MDLNGTVTLVAGGASGLGRATAEAAAAAGATVVVLDLPDAKDKLEGSGFTFAPADVRDADSVADAIAVATELGDLRLCVNCAGIGIGQRTARKGTAHDLDAFKRVIEINLIGTFNVASQAAAAMQGLEPVGEERGVLVNTASIAAFDGQIGQVAYSASKGGIVGMTLPIARDLARDQIRCMTIAPGIVDTPLLGTLSDDIRAALGASVPHPARLGKPAEYAQLVMAIAANPLLNGETIRMDGALRMAPQ